MLRAILFIIQILSISSMNDDKTIEDSKKDAITTRRKRKTCELTQKVAYLEYAVQRLENTLIDLSAKCGGMYPKVLRDNELIK